MSYTGWIIGYGIGVVLVIAVVALVTPILVLARSIGKAAPEINKQLAAAEQSTAALRGLNTTIEHATTIIAGLSRGRAKLGG